MATKHKSDDAKLKARKSRKATPLVASFSPSRTLVIVTALVVAAIGIKLVFFSHAATNLLDPTTATNNGTDTTCVFQKADQPTQVAFCDDFDSAVANNPAGSRSGDLNNTLWGVSRMADYNLYGGVINKMLPPRLVGCGTDTASAIPPKDVRVCNGRMLEAQDDNHGVVELTIYPKQPFDFAGRTGTVVFDVSADAESSHAAWPEFAITDKPNPGLRTDISVQTPPHAVNQVGFALDGGCVGTSDTTGVGTVFMSKDSVYRDLDFTFVDCVKKASGPTGALNHFEVRVSQNRMEVWGSDPGGANFKLLAFVDNMNLGFTKGLVWMNDAHYNARKGLWCPNGGDLACGTQWNHTFAWDNVGFDGPKTYRDLSFDVPDAMVGPDFDGVEGEARYTLGYHAGIEGVTLKTIPVYRYQTPTSALVTFNSSVYEINEVPSISINGHAFVNTPWAGYSGPSGETAVGYSGAVTVPVGDIVDGVNTITFKGTHWSMAVTNVNLILVAGAPVPGQVIPSATPTVVPTPILTPTPVPTATPAPTDTPVPTATPAVTPTPVVTPTPTPRPSTTPTPTATCAKLGDANCDGKVNNGDLNLVLRNYGKAVTSRAQGDLTGDGIVNIFDLSQVLQNWGR